LDEEAEGTAAHPCSSSPQTGGSLDDVHPGGSLLGTPAIPALSPAPVGLQSGSAPSPNAPDPQTPPGGGSWGEARASKDGIFIEEVYEVDGMPIGRPASPKYDGRTFFQSASLHPAAARDPGCPDQSQRVATASGSSGSRDGAAGREEDADHGWWLRPDVVTAAPTQRAALLGSRNHVEPEEAPKSPFSAAAMSADRRSGGAAAFGPSSDQAHLAEGVSPSPPPVLRGSASSGPSSNNNPSTFEGTATVPSPRGDTAQPLSLISPVRPISGQPTATPSSQRLVLICPIHPRIHRPS
jgi:hypothetical protein